MVSADIHRLPIAGRKRTIGVVPAAARRVRSKLPQRKRLALPIFKSASSDIDDEAGSSSGFCSGLSIASSLLPGGSHSSVLNTAPAAEASRPVTRFYVRQKQQLKSEIRPTAQETSTQAAGKVSEISESSCLESISEAPGEVAPKQAVSESSIVRYDVDPRDFDVDSDLACSERISEANSSSSEYSICREMTPSDFDSELVAGGSSLSSSGYSISLCPISDDDFSESSPNSAPSPMFALFLNIAKQLQQSIRRDDTSSSSGSEDQSPIEFAATRFDEEEDEEAYRVLKAREKREAAPTNYAEKYGGCGDLILKQRLLMVTWIVEHAKAMELQLETLFLGVGLLDRFLSRGYFKTERNLQLLGIASITLATRIEENQPYNSVRQRSFMVGNNTYTRMEVVAMEWVVMELLRFQCFPPTIHNFLWFYLKAARANAAVDNLARFLAVLSLLDQERLNFWPSTVAAGLVILASIATDHDSSCHLVMETHVRTENDDLPECIQSLEWLVKYAC